MFFCTEKCAFSEQTTLTFCKASAGRPSRCTDHGKPSEFFQCFAMQASRASNTPIRLDCVPPEVNTPAEPAPYPAFPRSHPIICTSISEPAGLWSHESIDWLAALISTSATWLATSVGQCRCASECGWCTFRLFSRNSPVSRCRAGRIPRPSEDGWKRMAERNSRMLPPVYILSLCSHAATASTASAIASR